ncbi:COG3650 family protein [Nostoc sp. UIC 10607]|uniref:COG3650 family protein n=1 Tax=Nostoc sp. UIC 10607 TaxID=3045935 RepID=UPI0039A128E7
MKTFTCCVALLLFGASFPANSPSNANESSITRNSLVVAETASNQEFIARGTEPFWSVTVSKRGIVYSSPDVKKQTFSYVAPLKAEARPADLVRVYRLKGKGNNILIIKKVDACSDGMSDQEYPYSAIFILENKILEGCAEKK